MRFPQPLDIGSSASTESDGGFELGLGPGRHLVTAFADGFAPTHKIVTVTKSGASDTEIRVLRGTEVWFDTKVRADQHLLFHVTDGNGVPVWSRHVWGSWTLKTRFPQGRYTLTVFEDERTVRTVPFRVGGSLVRVRAP